MLQVGSTSAVIPGHVCFTMFVQAVTVTAAEYTVQFYAWHLIAFFAGF